MFRRLPAAPSYANEQLIELATSMREDGQVAGGWNPSSPVQDGDNPDIPAGYTYFGQFVDHDLTFDPSSSLQQQNDPDALTDFRSPRFDLDSLFGSGPDDEPFQYVPGTSPSRLLLEGNTRGEMDLPRTSQGVAIIGDPRNDENTIVSQLHFAMAQAYNRFADRVEQAGAQEDLFRRAQRELRWHYQWVIAHDFLPRLCGREFIAKRFRQEDDGSWMVKRPHFAPKNNPYMPVEFSVAAYRFGHSQIRPAYDLNANVTQRPIFAPGDVVGETDDLRGNRPLPASWSVDWDLFLASPSGSPVQPSRLINSKLSTALFDLPGESDPAKQSLAFRNLMRGQTLSLPSGQDVARLLRAPRVFSGADFGTTLDPTPLWFYILKEAELENGGTHLGFCGASIVTSVMLGLLEVDKQSWINADPRWTPAAVAEGRSYELRDLLTGS